MKIYVYETAVYNRTPGSKPPAYRIKNQNVKSPLAMVTSYHAHCNDNCISEQSYSLTAINLKAPEPDTYWQKRMILLEIVYQ